MENPTNATASAVTKPETVSLPVKNREVPQNFVRSIASKKSDRKIERKHQREREKKLIKTQSVARKKLTPEEAKQLNIKRIKKLQLQKGIVIQPASDAKPATKYFHNRLFDMAAYFYEMATTGVSDYFSPPEKPATTFIDALWWLERNGYVAQLTDTARHRIDSSLQGMTFINIETNHDDPPDFMDFVRRCHNPAADGTQRRRMFAEYGASNYPDAGSAAGIRKYCGLPPDANGDLKKQFDNVCVLIDDDESHRAVIDVHTKADSAAYELLQELEKLPVDSADEKNAINNAVQSYANASAHRLEYIFNSAQFLTQNAEISSSQSDFRNIFDKTRLDYENFKTLHDKFNKHSSSKTSSLNKLKKLFEEANSAGMKLLDDLLEFEFDDDIEIARIKNITSSNKLFLDEVQDHIVKIAPKIADLMDSKTRKLSEAHKKFNKLRQQFKKAVDRTLERRDQVMANNLVAYADTDWTNFFSVGARHYPGLVKRLENRIPVVFYMKRSKRHLMGEAYRIDSKDEIKWKSKKKIM